MRITHHQPAQYVCKAQGILFLLFLIGGFIYCSPSFAIEKKAPTLALNKKGQAVLPDSGVYEGEYRNGLFHGKGKLSWSNGDRYSGDFRHGLFHGNGKMSWNSGGSYVGKFKKGMMHGKGREERDGTVYQGGFVNEMWHGKGKLTTATNEEYVGYFAKGEFHGRGRYVTGSGDVYKGKFKKGYPVGKGEINYKDGAEYRGEIKDWRMHGQGYYKLATGEVYIGEFKDSYYHGHGRFVTASGVVYEGVFVDGAPAGKGKIKFKNGNEYQGEIKHWRMDGEGVYKSKDGSVYSGQFVDGIQKGLGEIKSKSGNHYIGEIDNWYGHGKGELTSKDGIHYKGQFENGLYHGKGVANYKNGDKYAGEFKDGYRHGKGVLTRKSPKGHKKELTGWWKYNRYMGKNDPEKNSAEKRDKKPRINAESIFYNQSKLLDKALTDLKLSTPLVTDMYMISFAAYGRQDVFMQEATFSRKLFDTKYGTQGRSLALINNHKLAKKTPLATVTNLKRSLDHVAGIMDKKEDILFLFLTSHGSDKHELDVSLRGLPLNDLPAKELADMLKKTGIKWKVIVVSACYSGGFIKALKDEHTMVLTSAKSDHVSFGCSDGAEFTYFGRAFFKEALPNSKTFRQAFSMAQKLIAERETQEKYDHSNPQIWSAQKIENKLGQWRSTLNSKTSMSQH